MEHKRRKKKIKASRIIKAVIAIALVGGILAGVTIYLKNKVKDKFGSTSDTGIKAVTVESSSISTTVYGTGRLSDDDTKTQTIPDGVKLSEVKVAVGDTVKEGDEIAVVNLSSVLSAMSEKQSSIDSIDDQLEDAADEEIDEEITASVPGRVKKIFVEEGDDVSSKMTENNALMLLSIDGFMAVDLDSATLKEGDTVKVATSDGKEYDGEVESKSGDTVTILISDDGPAIDDTVTISDEDGNTLGTGSLYIHDELSVVGFAGTIKSIEVEENDKVKSGKKLLTLEDTSYTANYETLLSDRKALEDDLLALVEIYRSGAIVSEYEGTVRSIPTTEDDTSETASSEMTVCPDLTMSISVSIDETDILSLSVGQQVDVSVTSISEEPFNGTITEIDKSGSSSSGTTSYTATVQIAKAEGMLSGMSASASITIESVDNALIIPIDALKQTSSTAYVYTTYDEETGALDGMKEVEIGLSNSSYVEIKNGLSEGDTVYYQEKKSNSFSGSFNPGDFGGGSFPGGGFPGGSSSGGNSGFPGSSGSGSSKGGSRSKRGDS